MIAVFAAQPAGVISGGWPYVIAAYAVNLLVLLSYAAWLLIKVENTPSKGGST